MDKKKLDELSADHERWDSKKLGASAEHSKALGQAQILFAQAFDDCKDAVLKQHTRLRMSQIADCASKNYKPTMTKSTARKSSWLKRSASRGSIVFPLET
jgi:hypothetical protein